MHDCHMFDVSLSYFDKFFNHRLFQYSIDKKKRVFGTLQEARHVRGHPCPRTGVSADMSGFLETAEFSSTCFEPKLFDLNSRGIFNLSINWRAEAANCSSMFSNAAVIKLDKLL